MCSPVSHMPNLQVTYSTPSGKFLWSAGLTPHPSPSQGPFPVLGAHPSWDQCSCVDWGTESWREVKGTVWFLSAHLYMNERCTYLFEGEGGGEAAIDFKIVGKSILLFQWTSIKFHLGICHLVFSSFSSKPSVNLVKVFDLKSHREEKDVPKELHIQWSSRP